MHELRPAQAERSRQSRVTAFQGANAGLPAQLRALREQLPPFEYAELVEVLALFLEGERRQLEFVVKRRRRLRVAA